MKNITFPCTIKMIEHRQMPDGHIFKNPFIELEDMDQEHLEIIMEQYKIFNNKKVLSWIDGKEIPRKYVLIINGQEWNEQEG